RTLLQQHAGRAGNRDILADLAAARRRRLGLGIRRPHCLVLVLGLLVLRGLLVLGLLVLGSLLILGLLVLGGFFVLRFLVLDLLVLAVFLVLGVFLLAVLVLGRGELRE